jgi:hypothetical protein
MQRGSKISGEASGQGLVRATFDTLAIELGEFAGENDDKCERISEESVPYFPPAEKSLSKLEK